jgi:hypothetical protein
MDDAPMLLTERGRPDTTARHVLQALAEHAHRDGSGARPSVLRLQYRTGYDRRTVQRALRRLEDGKLIAATGVINGCTVYRLNLTAQRPATDWASLEADEEAGRAAATARKRRSRAKDVTHSDDVTVTHANSVTNPHVTHADDVRHAPEQRDVTHSASGRHALSAARTINEPSVEPPENPPPLPLPAKRAAAASAPSDEEGELQSLIAAMGTRGMAVSWPLANTEWFQLREAIRRVGIPALVDHAARAWQAAKSQPYSARYFLIGWLSLQAPPAYTGPRPLGNTGPSKAADYLADMAAIADELRQGGTL